MSEDQDSDKPPPAGADDRTVFRPDIATPPSAVPAPDDDGPAPAAPVNTVRAPAPEHAATRFEPPPAAAAEQPAPPPPVRAGEPRQIKVGDVLNHMFEVRRFIARGGMGEVFEGVAVDAEHDRVAIKVMLAHLAADPLVRSMFSREAQTLVKLRHPGLVQYRVVGTDPQLGVSYIVTDFVDGPSLSDVLRSLDPQPADLVALARRLAGALGTAHELGAIHRDIAPDNVLLEGGRLDRAKIIDFGIAKDLDPGTGTIVGDGFAGKLNYVAPEQLGSYERRVGPWTDVYSLALVLLAAARRRDVDMGGSLADSFEKRKAVPDLSAAPPELRPVLERMLQPDPAQRAQSMDEVQALLGDPSRPAGPSGAGAVPVERRKAAHEPAASKFAAPLAKLTQDKRVLVGGGAAVVALAAVLGIWALASGDDEGGGETEDVAVVTAPPAANPVRTSQEVLATGLATVPCAWLSVSGLDGGPEGVSIRLQGVAGDPAAAQQRVTAMLAERGVTPQSIDLDDVAPIAPTGCAPLEAFRSVRDATGGRLSVPQRQFELGVIQDDSDVRGQIGAKAIVEFGLGGLAGDAALYGLEESGAVVRIIESKANAREMGEMGNPYFEAFGNERYRMTLATDHRGWSGILLVTGESPGEEALIAGPAGSHDGAWQQRFAAAARERGWKTEMVWYKTVDNLPNN